ncbi:hypothetical protein DAI22_08g065050 [Oryza sativa Japonica Group]|nr:hypothetical protein DAI22_08g065050 [Oryza sativa Japonica Group]
MAGDRRQRGEVAASSGANDDGGRGGLRRGRRRRSRLAPAPLSSVPSAVALGGPATALSRLTRPRRRAATEGGTARQASDSIESAGRGRGRGGERRRREGRGSGEAEGRGRRPHEAGGICIKKQISRYECGRLRARAGDNGRSGRMLPGSSSTARWEHGGRELQRR